MFRKRCFLFVCLFKYLVKYRLAITCWFKYLDLFDIIRWSEKYLKKTKRNFWFFFSPTFGIKELQSTAFHLGIWPTSSDDIIICFQSLGLFQSTRILVLVILHFNFIWFLFFFSSDSWFCSLSKFSPLQKDRDSVQFGCLCVYEVV